MQAGELVGKLYAAFAGQYKNIDTDPHEQHSLNVLIVRLVFLLYAEDAGLLQKHQAFCNYMKGIPEAQMRGALLDLFKVLDTPEAQRDPYLEPELAAFPYINGGLFAADDVIVPNFTLQLKTDLLLNASQEFDWKGISPTIFGAAFESTLNPETRRSGGMHYTSIENIHKLIDPLFLDDLKAELAEIEGIKVERDRVRELRLFQRKLSQLKFLDPAAGSHNFLTETFLSLRKLEMRVIENLRGDQTSLMDAIENPIMVNINQFYAIEINDFAVSVGKTALWIAEQQMLEATQELLPYQKFDFLPLKSITNSHCGNALRMDWGGVLPAEECSYIIGNPPFVGARMMEQGGQQKQDIENLFGKIKDVQDLDYVSGWYFKASAYMSKTNTKAAFVSTNSICQGSQVPILWGQLFERFNIEINFAHQTFRWDSEASAKAHVYVVVVGFKQAQENNSETKRLFLYSSAKAEPSPISPEYINPYLLPVRSEFVVAHKEALCDVPKMSMGNMERGNEKLFLKKDELDEVLLKEPSLKEFIHPLIGAEEFLKGKKRWCFWLKDIPEAKYANSAELQTRIAGVKEFRLASKAKTTRGYAKTPQLFAQISQPETNFIVVPVVSSECRKYVPMAFMTPDNVPTTQVQIIPNATLFHFGILTSTMHMAWMRVVAGRLKSDYRYSKELVYNNFIWPDPTDIQRATIETCAQAVLDTRDNYSDKSLADLYDPDKMPADLLAAHKALDAAVEAAYGVDFNGDEEKIVAHLFKLYAEATKEE